MQNYQTILYENKDNITRITFNRPERLNAINTVMIKEFVDALAKAREEKDSRVVLISGKGKAFCAGADVKEAVDFPSLLDYKNHIRLFQDAYYLTVALEKPVIASVQGYALGGGCEFALLADIVIASDSAVFGFPEAAVGTIVTSAGAQILARKVGLGRAKELIFTTRRIDAAEAERIGLINKVVPADKLEAETMELIKKVKNSFAMPMSFMRVSLERAFDTSTEVVLELEVAQAMATYSTGIRKAMHKATEAGKAGKK